MGYTRFISNLPLYREPTEVEQCNKCLHKQNKSITNDKNCNANLWYEIKHKKGLELQKENEILNTILNDQDPSNRKEKVPCNACQTYVTYHNFWGQHYQTRKCRANRIKWESLSEGDKEKYRLKNVSSKCW